MLHGQRHLSSSLFNIPSKGCNTGACKMTFRSICQHQFFGLHPQLGYHCRLRIIGALHALRDFVQQRLRDGGRVFLEHFLRGVLGAQLWMLTSTFC